MAWHRPLLRRRDARSRRHQRGATLSEYAILASLVVVVSIGAITLLEDESGSYLEATGSDVGSPRALAADIDPDLPEPPPWLAVPPAPTTTVPPTTVPPTTAAPTTSVPGPTTTVPGPTSTTAPTSFPVGSVTNQGYMHSRRDPDQCFDAQSPGVTGSSIKTSTCVGAWAQEVKTVGDASTVALQFTDPPNASMCFSESGGNVVLAPCDGQAWQLFTVHGQGSGRFVYESRSRPGRCLESRSGGLDLRSCDYGRRQQMLF